MCSLAPRAAAPGFCAAAFLDRQRGVMAAPAATSRHNAGDPTTRPSEASAARKRGRHDAGFESEHDVVADPAAAASSSALRSRMDKEIVALHGLIKRAKLLPRRSADPSAEKKPAPVPRRSEPPPPPVVPSSSAEKRTTTTTSQPQPKAAATEAAAPACQTRITAPAANPKQQQQRRPEQGAAAKNPIAPEVPSKQRPAESPLKQQQQQQRPVVQHAARGAIVVWNSTREEFRQMLVEMEKAALPDETVYPEEMEALGIPFEFVVTRTWKQAMLDYHSKKVECS